MRGIIKVISNTIDAERQKGNKTVLSIANIETIYLDMLAKEKGYTNHDEE